MARKSTRENKSIYQLSREEKGWSRAKASEKLYLSEDSLERIEKGTDGGRKPTPEEVVLMAREYGRHQLCNYYCVNECAIGQIYVPEVKIHSLQEIAVGMMVQLNHLNKEKERFLEIAEDGLLSEDEQADFLRIKDCLDKMAVTIESLRVWVNNAAEKHNL